jgi:hypothetical protein
MLRVNSKRLTVEADKLVGKAVDKLRVIKLVDVKLGRYGGQFVDGVGPAIGHPDGEQPDSMLTRPVGLEGRARQVDRGSGSDDNGPVRYVGTVTIGSSEDSRS